MIFVTAMFVVGGLLVAATPDLGIAQTAITLG
jgi:hypothetical protein